MDESYDKHQKLFALSCLIASGKDWLEMERKWKLHLAAKNKQLKKEGRKLISRYHATDCSGRHNEFSGWTHDERDTFVKGLFGIFKRTPVHAVGLEVDLDDLCEVFPEFSGDRLKAAYRVLTKCVFQTIGEDCHNLGGGRRAEVTLFHDRTPNGKYDTTILESFNRMVLDSDFPYKSYFTTITPLSWENCIALQPADLVAFEVFKAAECRAEARTQRKSFDALLDLEAFGIHTRSISKDAMRQLRKELERYNAIEAL
jgi:hypothetical protein